MSTLVFDTMEHVKKLKAVGFTEAQAEVQTSLIVDLIETQVVTRDYLDSQLRELRSELKSDTASLKSSLQAEIASLKSSLQAEIASVQSNLQSEIASLKADNILLKWMMGIVMAGILALILKTFFPS